MSDFETIDFSNLDGETETDDPVDVQNPADVSIDILQPHLPPPPSSGRRNARERGIVVVEERLAADSSHSNSSQQKEKEENKNNFQKSSVDSNSNNINKSNRTHSVLGSETSQSGAATSLNSDTSEQGVDRSNNNSSQNPVQICYSKNTGSISVRQGQAVTTLEDGSRYIATQQIAQDWEEERKPLRKNRIRWVQIFSIIACVVFFPTGIPAAYFAFRVPKEFEEGVLRGNIDRAQKFATRSERLSVLSLVLCVLVAALVIALIERPQFQSQHYHRGTITG